MDPEVKKQTLRLLTYGLYVLTAAEGEDVAAGTVTWLSQASFSPSLVMVGVKADSGLHATVEQSGAFAVNILAEEQADFSNRFAWMDEAIRFDVGEWTTAVTGAGAVNKGARSCWGSGGSTAGDAGCGVGGAGRVTAVEAQQVNDRRRAEIALQQVQIRLDFARAE